MKLFLSLVLFLLSTDFSLNAQKPKVKKSTKVAKTSAKLVAKKKVITQNYSQTSTESASSATLVLRTDTDCDVYIDGNKVRRLLIAGNEERVYLFAGRHTMELKSFEGVLLENGVQLLLLKPASFQYFNIDLATKKQLAADKVNRENTDRSVISTAKELFEKKEFLSAYNLLKVQQDSPLMDAKAFIYLGDCLHNNIKGIPQDFAKAAKAYTKAYQLIGPKNSSDLVITIAELHRGGGNTLQKDANEAVKWYQKAYSQGNLKAQFELGRILFYGSEGIAKDNDKGLTMLEEAGEKGNADAQWLLGIIYSKGAENVAKDMTKAKYWYKKVSVNADEKTKKSYSQN